MVAVCFTFALSGSLPATWMGIILGVAALLAAALIRLLLLAVLLHLTPARDKQARALSEPGPRSESSISSVTVLAGRELPASLLFTALCACARDDSSGSGSRHTNASLARRKISIRRDSTTRQAVDERCPS